MSGLHEINFIDSIDWSGLTLRVMPTIALTSVLLIAFLGIVGWVRRRKKSSYPRFILILSVSCLILDFFALIRSLSASLMLFGEHEAVCAANVKTKAMFIGTYLDLFAGVLPVIVVGLLLSTVLACMESSQTNK